MHLLVNATCLATDSATGIERFASHICQGLQNIDNKVDILSSVPISPQSFQREPLSLKLAKRLFGKYEYYYRAFWDQTFFRFLVAQHKPDVVFFPIQEGLIFPSIKQIVTVHDLHYIHFKKFVQGCQKEIGILRTQLHRIKMPHILKHSSAIIAVSEATKKEIVDFFGINPDKIHVIYNGYDEQRFRVINNFQPALDNYGLKSCDFFLFVGSILRHKNILRLVKAFASLNSDMALVVAGVCKDAQYLNEIMNCVSDLGLTKSQFRYIEYVQDEDLPLLYNGARAVVLPSLHEGFGVPIIEAMACGTPVITSNCTAMPEVAGGAAMLVDPYSIESIAAAMQILKDNTEHAATMKKAGIARAKMFSWAHSSQQLYDVCKMVKDS